MKISLTDETDRHKFYQVGRSYVSSALGGSNRAIEVQHIWWSARRRSDTDDALAAIPRVCVCVILGRLSFYPFPVAIPLPLVFFVTIPIAASPTIACLFAILPFPCRLSPPSPPLSPPHPRRSRHVCVQCARSRMRGRVSPAEAGSIAGCCSRGSTSPRSSVSGGGRQASALGQ